MLLNQTPMRLLLLTEAHAAPEGVARPDHGQTITAILMLRR
ncbi:MAG: hypothetical protein QNJ03_12235 [Dinoroseobacter sp.]|nr:hypothetical protein [Dinoroseobacter sp.]